MVIDFHTHIFPDDLAHRAISTLSKKGNIVAHFDGTQGGLITSMKHADITASVQLPVVTKPSQTGTVNEWAAKTQGEGIIAFGGIHPQNTDWKQQIDNIVALGLKGVKMHPDYQDFYIDDATLYPMYNYILDRGLILLVHAGFDIGFLPPYHCTPERLAKVIAAMRGGNIVAAHLGGHSMWDEAERHLAGRNVYFDTSMGIEYYGYERLERMVALHGHKKILFGTDTPWSDQAAELDRMRKANLTKDQMQAILYDNAALLLGL